MYFVLTFMLRVNLVTNLLNISIWFLIFDIWSKLFVPLNNELKMLSVIFFLFFIFFMHVKRE